MGNGKRVQLGKAQKSQIQEIQDLAQMDASPRVPTTISQYQEEFSKLKCVECSYEPTL